MEVKEILEQCSKQSNREKSKLLFWALWKYIKTQRDKDIINQCIYECYCLVNNYMSDWDPEYKSFYERFLNLSVDKYGFLKIAEAEKRDVAKDYFGKKEEQKQDNPNIAEAVKKFLESMNSK